ncbi:hypothetical protein [Paenibacillus koleovorans]|uniref:hypothetical protein n=1 Tax=Paenibacillus koleovorans TaxID=121608 RepID=UPI000FDAD29E|nr:hypothetical protein [Paenibacillus koleovorans]
MNEMFWKAFDQWNTVKDSDVSQANDLLVVLMRHVFEKTPKLDLQMLDRIRLQMEYALEDDRPESMRSYNLGMARMITHYLHHEIQGKQQQVTINSLPNLERKMIAALGTKEQATPTQLAIEVGIDNPQQRSNLLRSLRAKDLVQYMGIGKNRFYSLTRTGMLVFERLRAMGETSAAAVAPVSEKRSAILNDFYFTPWPDLPQHHYGKSDESWHDEFDWGMSDSKPRHRWSHLQRELEPDEDMEGAIP